MPTHQPEKISIKQMYSNPTGKGSAQLAARYRVRSSLNAEFIKNLQRYRREFMCLPYEDSTNGKIYFWVKVPSRDFVHNSVKYDVIFEIENSDLPIQLRPCKFFCNSPSFIFTYAYVFNQEELLIDWLKPRLPAQCLSDAPKVRNPVESRGYELILYEALSYLIVCGCTSNNYILKFKQPFDGMKKIEMQTKVADPENLIKLYNYAKYLGRKNHKQQPTANDINERKQAIKQHREQDKKNAPIQPKGKIFAKKPRSSVSYRQASRIIAKQPTKVRPH